MLLPETNTPFTMLEFEVVSSNSNSNSNSHHHESSSSSSPLIEKRPSDDLSVVLVLDMDEVTQATSTGDMSSSEWDESQTSSSSSNCSSSSSAAEDAITDSQEALPYPEPTPTPCSSSTASQSSILKRPVADAAFLKDSRRSWQCLPQPDLQWIRRQNADSLHRQQQQQSKDGETNEGRKNSVAFGSVIVRCYAQTLGDNSCVSYGPPISLDWDYEEQEAITLDDYEDNRPPRRSARQMVLSYYTRKNILSWKYGITEDELKAAHKKAKQEKLRRNLTITLLPLMKVEDALESAKRKAKRAFRKQAV
jgi:hypothetical protein